ncbi:MAG TPA: hypothetical protein VFM43_02155 [Gaiellaceae bacterium]|nr:hypothetical protein [Gaiellaceae bacterium]
MGVQIDEHAATSVPAASMVLDESGFASFVSAGTEVSGDFRCPECGYGAVVHRALPPCPMCGGTVWESLELRAGLVG